jgi:hypothetical protein
MELAALDMEVKVVPEVRAEPAEQVVPEVRAALVAEPVLAT